VQYVSIYSTPPIRTTTSRVLTCKRGPPGGVKVGGPSTTRATYAALRATDHALMQKIYSMQDFPMHAPTLTMPDGRGHRSSGCRLGWDGMARTTRESVAPSL
jgi:hypothetical protein